MSDGISDVFADAGVKRRSRRGRTPWRRIYSCIEPSSLLYADAQDSGSDWDAKFNNFRRCDAAGNFFENGSDQNNNKQSIRMNSTRHITLTNEWSDVKTLKNRDVSIKFANPGKVLDLESILDPCYSGNTPHKMTSEKKNRSYDLKAARRRRHTVSKIEYTSPFLPIKEVNEERVIELSADTGAEGRRNFGGIQRASNDRAELHNGSLEEYQDISKEPFAVAHASVQTTTTTKAGRNLPDGSLSLSSSSDEEDLGFYGRYSKEDFQRSQASGKYRTAADLTITAGEQASRQMPKMENAEDTETYLNASDNDGEELEHNEDHCKDAHQESSTETVYEDAVEHVVAKVADQVHDPSVSVEDDVSATVSELVQKVHHELEQSSPKIVGDEQNENGVKTVNGSCLNCWSPKELFRRVSEPNIRYSNFQKRSRRKGKRTNGLPVAETALKTDSGDVYKRLYQLAIAAISKTEKNKPKISDFTALIQSKGIWISDPRLRRTCELIKELPSEEEEELTEEVFGRIYSPAIDFVRNILLGQMTIPGFSVFSTRMTQIFQAVQSSLVTMENNRNGREDGSVDPSSNYLDFMLSRRSTKERSISMSVCTVDGQRLAFGEHENFHSLDACANALNYCIACRQNGIETMKSYIGKTPLNDSKDEFTFDDSGKVLNPFTKAGAIMTSALLSQNRSVETQLPELHEVYSKSMADEAMCCDNLSYNLKRLYSHEDISLAYFLSARHKLPKMYNVTPGDVLELNFQSSSTATTSDACSVAAATLAAGGVCPLTGEPVFKEELVRHILKRMRASNASNKEAGLNDDAISFVWSESGSVFLVVPGVLGMSCFVQSQPRKIVREFVKCLVQNLASTFNFSVYRNLKRGREYPSSPRR